MPAWLRAALISVGALLILVLSGAVLLGTLFTAGSPRLSRRIIAEINRAVGTDSTRFAGDRVHGTLMRGAVIENPRLLVRTPDGEVTWASAKTLRVDYDLFRILLGLSQDLRVDVQGPRIYLVHDRSGEVVVPRFAHHESKAASTRQTRLEVVIRDGGFSIDREDIRFGEIHGRATLNLGEGRSELLIRNFVGVSKTPGRPGNLQMSGTVVVAGDSLRADPVEVGAGASRLTVRADWDLSEARFRSGLLSLHPLHLQEFLKVFEVQASEGTLRGEVEFSGTPTAGEARARLAGDYAGEPIDTLVLEARSRPGAVSISGFQIRVRDAEVTGQGTWITQGSVEADVAFHDLNPALLPWWQSPENMPQGRLAGEARIVARRAKPHPEVAAAIRLAPSRFGKLEIDGGTVRLHASPDGAVSIDSSVVEIPGARLDVTGVLHSDRSLDARVAGSISDLQKFNPLLHPVAAEAGSGSVAVRLTGTLAAPLFAASADFYGTRLENGLGCDTMTVEARGKLLPKLDLIGDVGARGLSAGARGLGNLDLTVAGGERLTIQRYRQTLGDTLLTLGGVLTFAPEGVRGHLDSLSLSTAEHRIRSRGAVDVSSIGDRVLVENLAFDLDPGVLEADIDWNPKGETVDARGKLDGLDLGRLPVRRAKELMLGGLVQGEFQVTGRIEDPTISIQAHVARPEWSGIVGDDVALEVEYIPGLLTLDRAEWVGGKSRARIAGTVRPRFTLDQWLRALGKGDTEWASRAALALEVSIDSLDLRLFAPVDTTLRTLEGVASLKARLTGTPAAPVLDLDARAPRIGFRGVSVELIGLGCSYDRRHLQIKRCDIRQGDAISKLSGEIPIDLGLYAPERLSNTDPIALSLRVPGGDLSVLPVLFPDIAAASGRITVTADVGGTSRKPRVTGSLKIADGKLRLAGRYEILEAIALDATFDQERVQLTKATARQGKKGSLSATGWWRWPTSAPPPGEPAAIGPRGDYQFKIKATDVTTTDRENYLFRLTGGFDIVNGRNPVGAVVPVITGSVVINKGELTLDLSKPAGDPGEPLPILYNVNVDIPGNVFYRTLDAEVELESDGTLIFRNEGNGDLALGVLNVKGGKYYIMTRQFRNLQGTVNFNSPDRIDPEVNITADTTIPDPNKTHTVYLALSDRVSRLKVRVYDDEGTPPNDLWKALALGQFAPSSGLSVASGTTTTQENPGVALPISNYLFQNLEHWLGGTGFIDTIDLRSGASATASGGTTANGTTSASAVSMVGVGKYVTPELYLKYSRDFSGVGEEQINADYRFTRHLLIKGQQIRRPPATQDLPTTEYSLDLKVRLEY